MCRFLKSIKATRSRAAMVLLILTIPFQASGQNAQVSHSSGNNTQAFGSRPGNKTPRKGDDIPCVAMAANPAGVQSPTTPTTPVQHHVDLTWKASSSPGVVKYYVYRCTPGGPCAPITSVDHTSYTDLDVQPQQTYCYFVTAAATPAAIFDSDPSNFVQALVPLP
jgi:hypothetical protein